MDAGDFQLYLVKKLDDQSENIADIKEDVMGLKVDVGVLKGLHLQGAQTPKRERFKDASAGGGVGAAVVGALIALWELFKAKSG